MTKEQIKEFTLKTSQANHSGLILILVDIDKIYMQDAIDAYEADDKVNYAKYVNLAKRAHNELMSTMNPADPMGKKVLNVLRYIYARLVSSQVKGKPQDIDRCIAMLETLEPGFEKLHELDTEGPVMQNTHRVYAGLTYGKGVLNESIEGTDYTRRGFKV